MKSIQDGLHANDEMNSAVEEIKISGQSMTEAIEEMIQANRAISHISHDLNEVSLQTKILAINAGVEASHAEERGATFAVVADKIREIAERSETAIRNSLSISETAIKTGRRVEQIIQKIVLHQQDVAEVLTRLASINSSNSDDALPAAGDGALAYDPKTMSTGVDIVDEQHRTLIEMINQLEQAAQQGKAREEVDRMLDFLGNYVRDHFAAEETIMDARHCPVSEKNKKAHAALIDTYMKWQKKYEAEGAKLSLVMDLKTILGQWLVSHICGVDRCLRHVT